MAETTEMNWLIRLLVVVALTVSPIIASAQTPVTHSTMTGQDLHQAFHYEQTSDPGNVGTGKWWFQTSTRILFRRNAGNTDWDQIIQLPDADLTTIAGLVCAQGQVLKKGPSLWECGPDLTTPASVTITETFALSGDISPPQITSDQTDYNPIGLSTAAVLRVSTDASRNLNTLAGGFDGRLLLIHNIGSFNLVFKNLGTGAAINQFDINTDVTLTPKQVSLLQYDPTSQKWRIIAGAGSGGGQAADNDLTALAALSGTGIAVRTAADTWAQRQVTGQSGNINITNPAGVAGDVLVDVGATVVQTDQSNTYTTGNQDFSVATSLRVPGATGAAPTASRMIAYDNTSNRLKYGANGVTFTIANTAEVQFLNGNLTALSGLTGAAAGIPYFTGPAAMALASAILCTDTAGQHLNISSLSPLTFICGTSGGSGISGLTTGKLTKALSATTIGDSIVSESGAIATVGGSLVVGTGPYVIIDTSAIATADKTWTVINQSGTIRPSTGALTPGNIVTTNANGLLVDGGAAGVGTWTDASSNTGSNKTLDESSNTLKITKSVQVELFAPTTDNASGNGQYYFRVPVSLNGTNLIGIQANVVTAGTTGVVSVQITRCAAVATSPLCSGTTASMLSTVASIDSGETSTTTAATSAVIDTANDDVATGQILRFDVTAVHTTPAKGLFVNLDFKLP